MIKKKSSFEIESYENLAPASVAAIINAVIAFFKQLKKKKEAGEKLSEAEEKALNRAEEAAEVVTETVKEEIATKTAKEGFPVVLVLAFILILAVAFMSGKKKK